MTADIPPDATIMGLGVSNLAAGAVGGIVRALIRPGRSVWDNITSAMVGALVAGYAAPTVAVVVDRYGFDLVPDLSLTTTVSFVLGVIGMSLCEALLAWVHALRRRPPSLPPSKGAP